MKNEITNIWGLPDSKIRVIFNGVDVHKFDGIERDWEFRRKFAMDHEKIVFFVGRMVNEKGVQVLIDAMPKICKYYNDVTTDYNKLRHLFPSNIVAALCGYKNRNYYDNKNLTSKDNLKL